RIIKRLLEATRIRCLRRYATSNRNILTLHERGIFQNVFPEQYTPDLHSHLVKQPQCMYCGFDPTADSLHIGNLLAVIALLHCQRAGHNPIALIGGATAQIGDPTGRKTEREIIDTKTIQHNVSAIRKSLKNIIENHELYFHNAQEKLPQIRILDNAEWYDRLNVIEFLAKVGRRFRMTELIHKSSVVNRLNSPEGMSFTEFTYQIFQAYDWLHLYREYNCNIQIGGNDQLGNIVAGYELISDTLNKRVFGLTVPLITTSSGEKLGKTAGNAIWLNGDKTSPYELYQYFLNLSDVDSQSYISLFTFLPPNEIKDAINKYKKNPEERFLQKKIAESVVKLVHGVDGLESAIRCTKALWEKSPESLADLHESDLKMLFKNAAGAEMFLDPGTSILDVIVHAKCFGTPADAVNKIKAGGVYVNNRRVTEPHLVLIPGEHILPNNITIIRIGKKNHYVVRWRI
ncbi:unnamed protein product, partial [Owenia fusiformis]